MPAGKTPKQKRFPEPMVQFDWNLSADAGVEGIQDWDVKSERFAEAVLCILATGSAVMFGTFAGGSKLSVTIMTGEKRARVYLDDSIALDDWADKVIGRAAIYLAKLKEAKEGPPSMEEPKQA
jgi:hypothetical protein